jgi:hypothetical protein
MQAVERLSEVLKMIVCPVCHGELALQETSVRCRGCRRSYPIEDGIPVLLDARSNTEPQYLLTAEPVAHLMMKERRDQPVADGEGDENSNCDQREHESP